MPVKETRDYRRAVEMRAAQDEEYIVEGYATTFDEPYVMYSWDGIDYKEQVGRHAFDKCEMKDVIMQYDHSGMVFARISNGTLELSVDDHGLKVRADLSKTAQARELFEAIKEGLVTEMSFAFSIEEDSYNNKEHLRTITKIKRLYDVSAVSIPANPGTEISARNYFDGLIEAEKAERLERAKKQKSLELKLKLMEV